MSIQTAHVDQARSEGSWSLLDYENSDRPKDAQSNSTLSPSFEVLSHSSQLQTIQKHSSISGYSIISSEGTNRTETEKIKRDLPTSKLRKLNLIDTKFKNQIENFDNTEICTIC